MNEATAAAYKTSTRTSYIHISAMKMSCLDSNSRCLFLFYEIELRKQNLNIDLRQEGILE